MKVSPVKKPLPVGISDYREACTNYYYIDKTLLIKDFLDERPKVSLFTRPRRFGKSLSCLRSKPTSKERKTFSEGWLWSAGRRIGKAIWCCTSISA